ncbi:hypothetical protein [Micromonospora sagamiensis]|uniref:DUF4350 domain-containing protein n=1 Tax=Micromonospora sagamiensis TaxID=47875 RepID=A0A562WGV8_9ACTN|nr:hypothetical protein [Micromonospora sagamiensis]TWJ29415.1 hypothetical protein JD81_02925 [Micromonospora sagamiensis]BCL17556.1 hypothetical protein GCM10017556_52950 [Micromonospora sagamiensis]
MTERTLRRRLEPVRWVALGLAVLVLVVFLVAQRQSIDVSYGRSPASAAVPEGSAGELTDTTVPSVAEMDAMVAAAPVVRLPGSVASWDEQRVREAIGDRDVRILVAPPGLDEAERDRIRDVEDVTVRVIGLQVSGGLYQATADTLPSWRAQFATGDVTGLLVTLIAALGDAPTPPDHDGLRWREPGAAELATVTADLRASGRHVADGATLTAVPARTAASAFPDGDALYVALPRQPRGEPVPRYGPALARVFPGRPIVVLYGAWIEYHGPHGEEFAEVTGASFYGQFGDRLSRYEYPQDNVLNAYLARVTDVRYAGLFERPLPYRPVDPLRVALPALPWLFAGCVVGFLALSTRSLWRGVGRSGAVRGPGTTARLAGLTALAVEMSLLTDRRSDPGLTRGVAKLQAARAALDEGLPDPHVRALLTDAEAELDDTARTMGVAGYRPTFYLRERLS